MFHALIKSLFHTPRNFTLIQPHALWFLLSDSLPFTQNVSRQSCSWSENKFENRTHGHNDDSRCDMRINPFTLIHNRWMYFAISTIIIWIICRGVGVAFNILMGITLKTFYLLFSLKPNFCSCYWLCLQSFLFEGQHLRWRKYMCKSSLEHTCKNTYLLACYFRIRSLFIGDITKFSMQIAKSDTNLNKRFDSPQS